MFNGFAVATIQQIDGNVDTQTTAVLLISPDCTVQRTTLNFLAMDLGKNFKL